MRCVAERICAYRIGRRFLPLTSATWNERTLPPRSTSETTGSPALWPLRLRGVAVLFLAADVGFIGLDDLAFAA